MADDAIRLALLRGDAVAVRELVSAARTAASGDDQARARLMAAQAFASVLDADFAAAIEELAVLGAAERSADPAVGPVAALAAAMAGIAPDEQTPGAADAVAAVLAMDDRDDRNVRWAISVAAEAAMSAGHLDLAEMAASEVWGAADPLEDATATFAGQTLMRSLLFQGRLVDAVELGPAVVAAARHHGLASLHLVALGTLAYLAGLRGDRRELGRCVTEIDSTAGECPQTYFTTGAMVLASYALAIDGQASAASDMLLRGAGGPTLPRIQMIDRLYGYELLTTAAIGLGDVDAARDWAERARALPGINTGMAAAAIGRIDATLAAASGDPLSGVALAGQASLIASSSTGHLDATRAELIAGAAMLHDTTDLASAQRTLVAASGRATAMGAVVLVALARRDLRSIGLRISGNEHATMSGRERQVAELVIAGLSNRQIARTLSISERTVQSHVGSVLRVLGLPSRTGVSGALRSAEDASDGVVRSVLTPRQAEVADLVVAGYTNDGVARALDLSVKTVEKHLGDIYRRLSVDSRSALAGRWSRDEAS